MDYLPIDVTGLSYFEGVGGHLDHQGAIMLTERFIRELEKTALFREVIANKKRL